MLTCSKTYRDIPFAHRQPLHPGHCHYIHGHNWSVRITFCCSKRDENGFVVDFGNLGYIKKWIADNLDHACLFAEHDPIKEAIVEAFPDAFKPYFLPDASCEGIALHLWEKFSRLLHENEGKRAWITSIDLWEDTKNTTRFEASREHIEKLQL